MARPRVQPISNQRLAKHITETGRRYEQIATAINQVADELSIPSHCAAGSLGRWLNGTVPQASVIPLVVEGFARLLNKPDLTADDLGWPEPPSVSPTDLWQGDPVAWTARLGRDDMLDRRTTLTAGLYSLTAAALPRHWPRITSRTGPARSAGPADVERIRQMTSLFADADDQYGGGHARISVAAYLYHEVAPLLRGTTGRARPELFTAASQLSYLLAWMAADDRHPGLAQRYYITAARLADEADDPTMRSTVLRSMAVQALELHHPSHARDLATAAAEGIRHNCPPRKWAWIIGMCSETLAADRHDAHRARQLLRQAEANLERADSGPSSDWTGNYRRESLEHQIGLTLTQLGDHSTAETHYATSAAHRRPDERRTRALITTELALSQLHQNQPDQAASTVLTIRDDLPAIASARTTTNLRRIRTLWTPHRNHPLVQQADRILIPLTTETGGSR